jgi:cyanophycinase
MSRRTRRTAGDLVLIGGGEDKVGARAILRAVAERAGERALVVCTLATTEPELAWQQYDRVFAELGVARRAHLTIDEAQDDGDAPAVDGYAERAGGTDVERAALDGRDMPLDAVGVVFFTGGDQMRLTSMLGGTDTLARLRALHRAGITIAGTSAGASAISDAMLIGGASDHSHKIGDLLRMAPGLGFMREVIVDQHFGQRGRVARLLAAVAQNPSHLGIGIDEDTACVVAHRCLSVIGSGAVYVIDGHGATRTNVSEAAAQRTMSISDVRLHVFSHGDRFDLVRRRPLGEAAATPRAARLHVTPAAPRDPERS